MISKCYQIHESPKSYERAKNDGFEDLIKEASKFGTVDTVWTYKKADGNYSKIKIEFIKLT